MGSRRLADGPGNSRRPFRVGGYQISHLAYATLGVLEGVLDRPTGIEDPVAWMDEDVDSARRTIDDVAGHYDSF